MNFFATPAHSRLWPDSDEVAIVANVCSNHYLFYVFVLRCCSHLLDWKLPITPHQDLTAFG